LETPPRRKENTMKLEVHERILLLELLPKEGDYAGLKAIRRAKEMISFSPEEQKFYEMKNIPSASGVPQVQWNVAKAAEKIKDVPIDEYITHLFRDALARLSREGKLKEDHISLYEKFVVTYE